MQLDIYSQFIFTTQNSQFYGTCEVPPSPIRPWASKTTSHLSGKTTLGIQQNISPVLKKTLGVKKQSPCSQQDAGHPKCIRGIWGHPKQHFLRPQKDTGRKKTIPLSPTRRWASKMYSGGFGESKKHSPCPQKDPGRPKCIRGVLGHPKKHSPVKKKILGIQKQSPCPHQAPGRAKCIRGVWGRPKKHFPCPQKDPGRAKTIPLSQKDPGRPIRDFTGNSNKRNK